MTGPAAGWRPDGWDVRVRLGVLIPQGDVGPESELRAMAPADVGLHGARVPFGAMRKGGAMDPTIPLAPVRDFAAPPHVDEAAAQLADAPCDLRGGQSLIRPGDLYDWAAAHVPDEAEAVVFGGNGLRAVGMIEALEVTLDRLVLTANQVLLWSAMTRPARTRTTSRATDGSSRCLRAEPVGYHPAGIREPAAAARARAGAAKAGRIMAPS
ncbi:hypothetical protein J7F03_38540 [Streptomyces sp. ISL-43]|uniref:hypothetical protein n=1 Tax=Streptomyces sp. ISL-43 TaxID=2819183 RepID=UPI001BEAE330|nr:hypothetical protein [Streptomyces sp. ISL-43]MBT2452832.1 hypothetical protein [Streptomyces sp. ISL-43]